MTRVLLLGYDPETVDFSDPALPPGTGQLLGVGFLPPFCDSRVPVLSPAIWNLRTISWSQCPH